MFISGNVGFARAKKAFQFSFVFFPTNEMARGNGMVVVGRQTLANVLKYFSAGSRSGHGTPDDTFPIQTKATPNVGL